MGRLHLIQNTILSCLALAGIARAGGPYYYTGAQWAVQAQCPANYPISCDSIGASDYCCPNGQYCTWASSKPACCPDNCECSGWSSGGDTYRPHSSYRPPPQSTYHPPPEPCHECYQPTTSANYAPQYSQPSYQGYCRTIYAEGPGLPTSRQGDCGLILITSPAPNAGDKQIGTFGRWWVLAWVVGLQVVGGLVLVWR